MSDDSLTPLSHTPEQEAAIEALKVVSMKEGTRNVEQGEAHQIELNRAKAAYRETMTPEDGARFDAIEQAVRVLEGARVPFALFARTLPTYAGGFWQYHRLTYVEDDTARVTDYTRSIYPCLDAAFRFFSKLMPKLSLALLRDDGTPEELYRTGQWIYSRPPTPPATDTPTIP